LAHGRKIYDGLNITFTQDALPALETLKSEKYDFVYAIAVWQYLAPAQRELAITTVNNLLSGQGLWTIVWPIPESREYQYSLSEAELLASTNAYNMARDPDQMIKMIPLPYIPDPDKRMGYHAKDTPVIFHAMVGGLIKNLTLVPAHLQATHKMRLEKL
jgi:hypothetical protein